MTKQKAAANSAEDLDLLPPAEAKRRTDTVLRAMLASPPAPHIRPKPRKRAKRAK